MNARRSIGSQQGLKYQTLVALHRPESHINSGHFHAFAACQRG